MQKKKAVLAVTAVAIASLAIVCGFVAFRVLKIDQKVARAETQLLYGAALGETFVSGGILARASEPILELDDDRELRRAIDAFRRSQGALTSAEKRAVVSLQLHRYLLSGHGSQAHQSVAWDLIGILSLEDASEMIAWGNAEGARQFVAEGLESFRSAIALHGANPDAKRHLELLLTLIENNQVPNPNEGSGVGDDGQGEGNNPNNGAGVNPPGTGY